VDWDLLHRDSTFKPWGRKAPNRGGTDTRMLFGPDYLSAPSDGAPGSPHRRPSKLSGVRWLKCILRIAKHSGTMLHIWAAV
jgi:hypothetical protein